MRQEERFEDPEEALRIAFEGFQSEIWTAMPAIVDSFDPVKQTCSVIIAIQGIQTAKDGTQTPVTIYPLVDVPVYRLRGGGFAITVPLIKGDEGLVVLASRCIDMWWQNGASDSNGNFQAQPQFEQRLHDLSDGFFLPGFNSQPKKLASFCTTGIQIRNDAGDTTLTLNNNEIDIVATTVKITGDLTVTGKLTSTDTTSLGGGSLAVKLSDGSNATKVKAT